jgi:tetratricopeptide (TPR) repeat protein
VLVARQTLDEAARELAAGIAGESDRAAASRFSSVALHWLLGLIHLSQGDESRAMEEFERELVTERDGHLYARECCANTWYAIGALRLRQSRPDDAAAAFQQAVSRVPRHPMARLGLLLTTQAQVAAPFAPDLSLPGTNPPIEAVLVSAAAQVLRGSPADAARLVDKALSEAPAGSAAWLLPIEPLLNVTAAPDAWASALARIRSRAA